MVLQSCVGIYIRQDKTRSEKMASPCETTSDARVKNQENRDKPSAPKEMDGLRRLITETVHGTVDYHS